MRPIISVTSEIEIYPSSKLGSFCLSIPKSVQDALEMPKKNDEPFRLYVLLRDMFGNLICHRLVEAESNYEVKFDYFTNQFNTGQLYPSQRIRLEVSLP